MLAERNHYSFCKQIWQCPSTNYASSVNGFKMGWMEVAGTVYPPIFGLKLPIVKARVPNQKRPSEWRVGLKILGGRFSRWWTKWSNDGELALDDAGLKKQWAYRRERWSLEKGENTRSLDLCVPILSMPFVKLNGAEANSLGWLFGCLSS